MYILKMDKIKAFPSEIHSLKKVAGFCYCGIMVSIANSSTVFKCVQTLTESAYRLV